MKDICLLSETRNKLLSALSQTEDKYSEYVRDKKNILWQAFEDKVTKDIIKQEYIIEREEEYLNIAKE